MIIYIQLQDFMKIIILSEQHRNEYCLIFLQFNYISKSYHSSFSYIKGQKQSPGGVLLKSVPRNFAKFTGKHLCRSLFVDEVAGLRPGTILKKRIWHITKHLRWLLLKGRSDFQTKRERDRDRDRDLKSTAADRNSITISYINAMKHKRPFY